MRFAEGLRRRRATRGYGVHSPLAFRLVKEVVRPPKDVAYYGEEKLAHHWLYRPDSSRPAVSRRELRRALLLLRFVARMRPSYIWTSTALPEIYSDAISLAGCVVRIFDGKVFPDRLQDADMVVIDSASFKKKDLQRFLSPGKAFAGFSLKPSLIKSVGEAIKGGVMLSDDSSLLAVATADPSLHSYKVLLP